MKIKKQIHAEHFMKTGDRLMTLLLLLAVAVFFIQTEMAHHLFGIFEHHEIYFQYAPLILLAAAAAVYYITVRKLYEVLNAVSHFADQLTDCILDDGHQISELAADISLAETDDGIFSKICGKLKKLSDAKALSVQKTKKETSAVHTLISDISHQVKTPAANIKIYTEMLEKHVTDEECGTYLNILREQADRLDFLMKTLIKMSRLETDMISLRIREHRLLDIVASALGEVLPAAEEKHISIQTECGPELMVTADERWTSEAVFNILDNAVKYTERGGSIKIRTMPLQSYTVLEIADTGIGISGEELPLIFQRF